jgi:hypothetical protein
MKTKTIRLGDDYRLNPDGTVSVFGHVGPGDEDWGWRPSVYRVGAKGVLISRTDVSPNAIRSGQSIPIFSFRVGIVAVGGNSNPDITRAHGWRGTTNDTSVHAHGRRRIVSIRPLKRGGLAVTVGPDLAPEEP